jgi:para-aminobenzoate synthetase/4-amino-4-deoxychorismate lyase
MTRPDPWLGVFETLLVRDGRVQALAPHLDRLAASVSELYGARLPWGLRTEILSTARGLTGEHRMRVDAVPDAGGARVTVTTSALSGPRISTANAVPITIGGGLGPHKWCDRRQLDAIAERVGSRSVVMICDDDGQVLEAAWANVWLLEGGRLRTPPADGRILPGVTRARLFSLAQSLGLEASEAPITPADVRDAPTVFVTSSLRVTAVTTLVRPSTPVDSRISALAQALAAGDWS